MRMANVQHEKTSGDVVEFVKGCPICEHTDPELERDLEDFAQILFEMMLDDQKRKHGAASSDNIDNPPGRPTLKERSAKQSNYDE